MDCTATRACPSCAALYAASRVNPTCDVKPGNDDLNLPPMNVGSPVSGSLHLQIELAHQRSPLRLFAVDVLGVLLGGRGQGVAAFGHDALLDLGALRQHAQRGV